VSHVDQGAPPVGAGRLPRKSGAPEEPHVRAGAEADALSTGFIVDKRLFIIDYDPVSSGSASDLGVQI